MPALAPMARCIGLKRLPLIFALAVELGESPRRRLDRDRTMRAERLAGHQHRPVAVVGAAIDQRVVGIGNAAEEQLEVRLVLVVAVEQQAPVAVAIGKRKQRVVIEPDDDVALMQDGTYGFAAGTEAAIRPRRADPGTGLKRKRRQTLGRGRAIKRSRPTIEGKNRLRHRQSL